jgi:hypothetical protein
MNYKIGPLAKFLVDYFLVLFISTLPGRITLLRGRDLTPPGYILHPASTLAPCASPGTPLGSDWHILHRHMLVLGRPLAQISIFLLS